MKSLAVVPFTQQGNLAWAASGLSGYLIREFGKDAQYRVISETSSAQITGDLPTAGQQLKCDYIISGELIEDGALIVLLKIYSVVERAVVWEDRVEAPLDRIIELGSLCFQKLCYRLTPQSSRPASVPARPINNEAYQLFLQGKHYFNRWNEENAQEAGQLFTRVIALEPGFVPAYHWLSKVYIFQAGRGFALPSEVYPQAIALNQEALSINPHSGEALIYRGLLDFFYHLDWDACYRHIQQGLDHYVDASEAYQQLSLFWYGMREYDQSLAALNAAQEFDPLSTGILNMIGDVHISRKDYDQAEKVFLSILKLNPDDNATLENLGYIYTLRGNPDRAFFYFNKLRKRLPLTEPIVPRLGLAYARFGRKDEVENARRLYEQLAQKYPKKVFSNHLANLYAGLDEWDQVLTLITKGWKKRTGILFIATDPLLEPIRNTRQYRQLLREITFPTHLQDTDFVDLLTETDQTVRVNAKALLYLEADDNYVTLFLYQNFRTEQMLIRQTLTRLLEQLPNHFRRVHRKYAINLHLDLASQGNARGLILTCKQYDFSVPVARGFVSEVRTALE